MHLIFVATHYPYPIIVILGTATLSLTFVCYQSDKIISESIFKLERNENMDRRKFLENLGLVGVGATGTAVFGRLNRSEARADAGLFLPLVAGEIDPNLTATPTPSPTPQPNGAADHFSGIIVAAADASAVEKDGAHFVCSGTNDHAIINQAINSLGDIGGLVRLTAGTYNCAGAIKLNRRISLIGVGRGTKLKAIGTWAAYDGVAQGGVIEPADSGIDKTLVGFLTIDGNRWDGGDTRGIYYNINSKDDFDEGPDAGHYFTDIYIYRTQRHGFHITGSHMRATKATRLRVYNVGDEGNTEAHGFYIQSPDGMYTQCETGSSSGHGFNVDGANNHFTNCKAWFSDLNGWHVQAVRGMYSVCEAQDNAGHGFYITSGPNSFSSCHADSNSWEPNNPAVTYDGFHIPWGSRIQLIGCSAYDKNEGERGNWQRYGFFVGSGAEHIQILGTVKDNATAGTGGDGIVKSSNNVMVAG